MGRAEWLEKAAQTEDLHEALDALLLAWRADRAPDVAAAVELVSEQAIAGQRRPEGTAEWDALEATQRAPALGLLLERLVTRRSTELLDRLHRLKTWPADPRLSGALHRLLLSPPLTATSTREAWREVYRVLGHVGDPRTLEVLQAAPRRYTHLAKSIRAWFSEQLQRLAEDWRAPASSPLTAMEQRWLQRVRTLAAGATRARQDEEREVRREQSLLRAVYAAPHDDAPRLVYADLLSARDDPRGEFIVLECEKAHGTLNPTQRRRHDALLRKYGTLWKGRLARAVATAGLEYERGFPVAGALTEPVFVEQVLDADEWRTFRALDLGRSEAPELARLLAGEVTGGLVQLYGVSAALLPALRDAACLPGLLRVELVGAPAQEEATRRVLSRASSLRVAHISTAHAAWSELLPRGVELVHGGASGWHDLRGRSGRRVAGRRLG